MEEGDERRDVRKAIECRTGISDFMEDEPIRAKLAALRGQALALTVYISCAWVAGLIPVLHALSGGHLLRSRSRCKCF